MTTVEAAIPLDRAALCLSCQPPLLFHISRRACPGCGGDVAIVLVEKILGNEKAEPAGTSPAHQKGATT